MSNRTADKGPAGRQRNAKVSRFFVSAVKRQQYLLAFIFLTPTLLLLGAFMIYPILATLRLSFFEWNGIAPQRWVGLQNFRALVDDPVFREALAHSLAFVILGSGIAIILAFCLAHMLFSEVRGARVYRVLLFVPYVLPGVVVGLLWQTIYDPNFGLLTSSLRALGLDSLVRIWLGDPQITLYAVIWVYIWKTFPFHMLLFFVGMQDLPQEVLESAALDGANSLQRIRYIIIPLLMPVIVVATVLSIIWGLRVFDLVYIMTRGGPGYSTQTVASWLITTGFSYGQLGKGSAMAVVLFLLIMLAVLAPLRLRKIADEI